MAKQADQSSTCKVPVCSKEAEEFVDSVMGSQRVVRVDTPVQSGRKRHLSEPSTTDTTDSSIKKARVTTRAKRTLYRPSNEKYDDAPDDSPNNSSSPETARKVIVTDAEVHVSADTSVETLIKKLSADMHMMFMSMNERMEKLESSLEQRISSKVAQLLDKRVNSELSKMKKEVEAKLVTFKDELKAEVTADITDINKKLRDMSSATISGSTSGQSVKPDKSLNVVIRGLPSTDNENVARRVNALIKDGLRVDDVTCVSAERKRAYNDSKPGVIIATFGCHDSKRKVMMNKKKLKNSRQFDKVFLDHDLSLPDRIISNNFRTILGALREQNLTIRGTRVVHVNRENNSDQNGGRSRDNNRGSERDNGRDYERDRSQGDTSWRSVHNNSRHIYDNRRGNYHKASHGHSQTRRR